MGFDDALGVGRGPSGGDGGVCATTLQDPSVSDTVTADEKNARVVFKLGIELSSYHNLRHRLSPPHRDARGSGGRPGRRRGP